MSKSKTGTESLLGVLTAWRKAAPEALRKLDPIPVIGILELSSREGGTFLKELQGPLGIRQPWASKLALKLEKAKLITSQTPAYDRRRSLISITARGKKLLATLDIGPEIGGSRQAERRLHQKRPAGIKPVQGQHEFELSKYLEDE